MTRALQPGEDVAVQQTLLEVDRRLERAPEGVTLFHVQRLLNNWKNDRNAEEKEWQFDDWAEDLEEFSEIHLKAACRHYRQNNVFPPKIAEIRALCLQEKSKDEITHRRCRVLLGLEDPKPCEQLPARQAEPVVMLSDQRRALLEQAVGPLDQLDKKRVSR